MIQDQSKAWKSGTRNLSVKALRKIIDRSQSEFAALIGVSVNTVVSWENGRNRLTPEMARLIHLATGARPTTLMDGKGQVSNEDRQPFSLMDFQTWHRSYLDASDEIKARYFHALASSSLFLLFAAAAKPGAGKLKNRLPGLWGSFLQWGDHARDHFRLNPQIKAARQELKKALQKMDKQAESILRPRHFRI